MLLWVTALLLALAEDFWHTQKKLGGSFGGTVGSGAKSVFMPLLCGETGIGLCV